MSRFTSTNSEGHFSQWRTAGRRSLLCLPKGRSSCTPDRFPSRPMIVGPSKEPPHCGICDWMGRHDTTSSIRSTNSHLCKKSGQGEAATPIVQILSPSERPNVDNVDTRNEAREHEDVNQCEFVEDFMWRLSPVPTATVTSSTRIGVLSVFYFVLRFRIMETRR
ncbi:hypothetical protein CC2G_015299 [Coprinopsis cinerea AmutBmut pab1-1]|nr:hypothetical protein CC2G_015299 [Coprinopsis cinerea AmutBmut pab1-1]